MKVKIFMLMLLVFWSSQVSAKSINDGNDLLLKCNHAVAVLDNSLQGVRFHEASFCIGFLEAITSTNNLYQMKLMGTGLQPVMCLPDSGLNNGQAARIVVKYLKENPQKLHLNRGVLAIIALGEAFPCKEKGLNDG